MDVVDRATRSRMMSGIRGKDTKPELAVRSFLHRAGLRFRLHAKLPGKPDLVLPRYETVVFVHGCFWHRHEGCRYATTPASNVEFWQEKFAGNVQRDARVKRQLEEAGWRVETVWACQLGEQELAGLADRIRNGAPAGRR
ncbi:very short patch repair endonuclease [Luteimonas notoginsengisoli]|uniref:Very short patch repair endonuclease n=1 Tax=Luteimonas notoginsengisoli TaxID=1578200 RepID=A0ABV7UUI2_9GAMM